MAKKKIEMNIRIFPRKMYGKTYYYPICETAKMLCELLKQKSFIEENVAVLEKHGIEIEKQ